MGSVANSAVVSGMDGTGLEALDEKTVSPTASLKQGGAKQGMNRESTVDRGTIVVSWYEGTTSNEMTDHVFNCVLRKLNSDGDMQKKQGGRFGWRM